MKRTLFDIPYLTGFVCLILTCITILLFGDRVLLWWILAVIVDFVAKKLNTTGNIWRT